MDIYCLACWSKRARFCESVSGVKRVNVLSLCWAACAEHSMAMHNVFLYSKGMEMLRLEAWQRRSTHTQAKVFVWERCNLCLCGGKAIILWSQCDCREPQMQISTEGLCLCNVCGRTLTWMCFARWENIQSLTFFGSLFEVPDFHSATAVFI